MSFAIQTNNLTKKFFVNKKEIIAVNGIDLEVKTGEIFGLLGPNGAGKTTTMRMLTTLLKPTAGAATVVGYDLASQPEMVRLHIGYVSQTGGLERDATGRENLILQTRIFGKSKYEAEARVDELIKAFGLQEYADRYVKTYSGGQRRKTDILLGLVHKPKLLFLDEPTTGLDPAARVQVWEQIRKLRDQGTTIVLTTHYLDEADNLCDRVAIVDRGIVVALDAPSALKREIGGDTIVLETDQPVDSVDTKLFDVIPDIKHIGKARNKITMHVSNGENILPQILRLSDQAGVVLTAVSFHRPTLDDVFLQKTGRSLVNEIKAEEI